jgi:hypothetical protein
VQKSDLMYAQGKVPSCLGTHMKIPSPQPEVLSPSSLSWSLGPEVPAAGAAHLARDQRGRVLLAGAGPNSSQVTYIRS